RPQLETTAADRSVATRPLYQRAHTECDDNDDGPAQNRQAANRHHRLADRQTVSGALVIGGAAHGDPPAPKGPPREQQVSAATASTLISSADPFAVNTAKIQRTGILPERRVARAIVFTIVRVPHA